MTTCRRVQGDRIRPSELQLIARAVRELTAAGHRKDAVAARLGVNVKLVRRILAVRT